MLWEGLMVTLELGRGLGLPDSICVPLGEELGVSEEVDVSLIL